MRSKSFVVCLVALACGRTGLDVEVLTDGSADVATRQPDAVGPSPDVDVPEANEEASSACTMSGDYYVAVNDDAGTEILEAGCAPLAAPSGGDIVVCGHLVDCLGVVACGAGYVYIDTKLASQAVPPGSFPVTIRYAPTGWGSERDYEGTFNVSNVVDGTLGGTFTTTGPISGTFCVQWQ